MLLRLLRTPSRLPWTGLQLVLLESGNPATRGTVSTFLGMRRLCGDPTSTWILQPRAARRVLPTVQTVAMGAAARCSGTMARPNSGAVARAGAMLGSSVPQRLASASRMIFTSTNVANAGSSTSPTSACRSPQVRSSQRLSIPCSLALFMVVCLAVQPAVGCFASLPCLSVELTPNVPLGRRALFGRTDAAEKDGRRASRSVAVARLPVGVAGREAAREDIVAIGHRRSQGCCHVDGLARARVASGLL